MNHANIVDVFVAQATPAGGAAASNAPPALPQMDYGFFSAVLNAGLGEKIVMGILLIFSVISWAIIAQKWWMVRRAGRESDKFLDAFWGSKRLDSIYQKSEGLTHSPVSQVFRAGYIELAKLKKVKTDAPQDPQEMGGDLESVERSMRRASASELTGLESSIPFLATTGSTAPFIGLFGTVIGIVNSFRDIGLMGNANLATVAPGIGGALVATAFGLFAAIPAVIAYNFFLARIRVLDTEMQNFSADFLNIVKRHFF